jgi:hypothetical protein
MRPIHSVLSISSCAFVTLLTLSGCNSTPGPGMLVENPSIQITLALPLNNEAELDREISEIYRSGEPSVRSISKTRGV